MFFLKSILKLLQRDKENKMRNLTKEQKTLLNRQVGATSVDDMSTIDFEELEELNEYETLWSDANRYLSDNYFANQIKKDW